MSIQAADKIVGIETEAPFFRMMNDANQSVFRRGQYAQWFASYASREEWPHANEPLGTQAERIVKIHTAKQPKGDGMPKDVHISTATFCLCNGVAVVSFKAGTSILESMTDDEQAATQKYLQRCFEPATRRFLAAFECVDNPTPLTRMGCGSFICSDLTAVYLSGQANIEYWIKPREVKS